MKKYLLLGIVLAVAIVTMVVISGTRSSHQTIQNPPLTASVVPPTPETPPAPPEKPLSHYIEIINGCGTEYDTTPCVNMRSSPSTSQEKVASLRTGIVLKVEANTVPGDGHDWYKVIFDKEIRYPERVAGDWYVAVDPSSVRPFEDIGDVYLDKNSPSTTKRIVISRSKEILSAYDGDTLFMEEPISTGLELTPTPRGNFTVYKKTPSRYMQGPIPGISDQEYDLPGVPWNLYFTVDGAVIHGAYWHNHFGIPWSHGCVNLSPENAQKLYNWADIGTHVIVQD